MRLRVRVPLVGLCLLLCCGVGPATAGEAVSEAVSEARQEVEAFLTIERGTVPIILSAPHGGTEEIPEVPPRKGEGVPQFVTVRDTNTLELAQRLADAIEKEMGGRPYIVFARFRRTQIDANRAAEAAYESPEARAYYDAYHGALAAFANDVEQRWGSGLLLDLHGQRARNDAIIRGTRNLKTVAALVERHGIEAITGPHSVLGALAEKGYTIEPVAPDAESAGHETRFTGGHIVAAHGSADGGAVDAIQLEFGGDFRTRRRLDRTAADVAEAVAIFARAYLPQQPLAEEAPTASQ